MFESFNLATYSLKLAQEHIDRKLAIANTRKHGSHLMRPIDVFERDEKKTLKALPVVPYEVEKISTTDVRDDGYVRFLNKFYRVDSRLKREAALVIGNSEFDSIYCGGRLIETYPKITDQFKRSDCKAHLRESK